MIRILFCCLLFSAEICRSATLRPSDRQLSIFSRTVDLVFSDSFDQAYRQVEAFPDSLPGQPIYHLLYGSVLHARMLDCEDYADEKIFFVHIDSAISVLRDWVERNPHDAWGYFFLGSAYGYKSILLAQKHSWLKSLVNGLKAKTNFSRAIEINPTLYDAYTGMGNYHYWSTVKLGKYIPLIPDNREKGLGELQLALDSSLFSRKPARAGLAWAFIEEKKLTRALRIGTEMYKDTGGGRNSLWIMGGAYWRAGNLLQAADYYGKLIESFLKVGNQNYYNLIFCRYRRGVCLYGLGRDEQARFELESILSYEASKEVRKRHKNTYEKTREYLEKLEGRARR